MLIKEYLHKQNRTQKELAEFLQLDENHVSKLATYKCLPTPQQANQICLFLNCNILDIYNKSEIDLIKGTQKASRNNEDSLYYRLSVRLNKSGCNCLKPDNLNLLGFKTLKSWVLKCMEELAYQQKLAREYQRLENKGVKNEK